MKQFLLVLVFACSICHVTSAQESKPVLTLQAAQQILSGCLAYADSAKLNFAIAIYNSEGQLISFARMTAASLGVAKVSQWKGFSAAIYQTSTEQTAGWNADNAPDIATIPGGLPIFSKDGSILGGIGVSGAAASIDVKCAEAGLKSAGLRFAR